jgi:hypothetical protein
MGVEIGFWLIVRTITARGRGVFFLIIEMKRWMVD